MSAALTTLNGSRPPSKTDSSASGAAFDGGNLSATVLADGRMLTGRIWLNGAQADWPAALQRR